MLKYRLPQRGEYCLPFNTGGFILLEVLVSVIILTIGLVAVLGAFSTSGKIIVTSDKYETALQLAESKLFEIENTPPDDRRDYGHGGFGDKYSQFAWEYEINEKDSEFINLQGSSNIEPDTFNEIKLTVTYKERGKTITPVTLVTYETARLHFLK